jgi:hypothetical protein
LQGSAGDDHPAREWVCDFSPWIEQLLAPFSSARKYFNIKELKGVACKMTVVLKEFIFEKRNLEAVGYVDL